MATRLWNKVILSTTLLITFAFLFNYCVGVPKDSATIRFYGDALGYYLYLPSAFIYHDLKSPEQLPTDKAIQSDIFIYADLLKSNRTPKGYALDQYTYGVALMESPFFFIAHAYEQIKGRTDNGYSLAYIYMIKVSSFVYAFLGLILVYFILKKYFDPTLSLAGTAVVFLGTNLFYFSLYQTGMAHVPLFFLYALLIFLTIKVHEKPSLIRFAVLGFVAGIIVLIRPTDMICLLIPLLYNAYSKETVKAKISLLRQNIPGIFFAAIAFLLPLVPQLLYWKAMTGSYVFYSYGTSQSFNWAHPKIIEGLFYGANGWLMYSPVMIFSVAGLFFLRYVKQWALVQWMIFPLYVYIIYSWYCYNYINGLGSRPMIHLYPLLAISLTAFIRVVSRAGIVVKTIFGALVLFFVAVNISFCIQQSKNILVSESSSLMYNEDILFRMHLNYNDLVLHDVMEEQPDTSKIVRLCTLSCEHYEDSLSTSYEHDTAAGSKYRYHKKDEEVLDILSVKYDKEKFRNAIWFKCSGRFMYPFPPSDWRKHSFILAIPNKIWKGCEIENKIGGWENDDERRLSYSKPGQWGEVSFFVKIPAGLNDGDVMKVYIWDLGRRDLYVDDVCLELYKSR